MSAQGTPQVTGRGSYMVGTHRFGTVRRALNAARELVGPDHPVTIVHDEGTYAFGGLSADVWWPIAVVSIVDAHRIVEWL